jgi:DNA-binding response OmpR family regulator
MIQAVSDGLPGAPFILLVDDDDQVRSLMHQFLARDGYDVGEAATVPRAQDLLREIEVHLVIVDLFMPGQDGFEFLRKLRGVERTFKILAISGYGEPYLGIARAMGADAVITKPFSREELLAEVKGLLLHG